jgi:hypothetical protein
MLAGIVPASCDVINELRIKYVAEEDGEDNDASTQRFEGMLEIMLNRMPEARRKVDDMK